MEKSTQNYFKYLKNSTETSKILNSLNQRDIKNESISLEIL